MTRNPSQITWIIIINTRPITTSITASKRKSSSRVAARSSNFRTRTPSTWPLSLVVRVESSLISLISASLEVSIIRTIRSGSMCSNCPSMGRTTSSTTSSSEFSSLAASSAPPLKTTTFSATFYSSHAPIIWSKPGMKTAGAQPFSYSTFVFSWNLFSWLWSANSRPQVKMRRRALGVQIMRLLSSESSTQRCS